MRTAPSTRGVLSLLSYNHPPGGKASAGRCGLRCTFGQRLKLSSRQVVTGGEIWRIRVNGREDAAAT